MPGPAPAELLAAFGRLMNERRWRWYIFGAQAVIAYGRPRLTADIDITVEATGTAPAELVGALALHNFDLRFPLSEPHLRDARLLPMVHRPTAMPLDLVIAAPGLDEEFLERARLLDLGGVNVPVVSAEDLVAMKILAGRRKDIEDVRGILAEQKGQMDLDQVRDVLASFEEALDERKLLTRFNRLVRTAGR